MAILKNIFKESFLAGAALCFCLHTWAMSPVQYIQKYKDCAIEQMLVYNIPASITLAQGMLESDYGNSPLAKYANNHFGIKCHDDWTGPYYAYDDDHKGEHFRKYATVDDSYRDHAQFLRSRPWYAFLFRYPRTDYHDWAIGLSKAGYATAPDYSKRLIEIINENHLYVYDTVLQSLKGLGILYDVPPVIDNNKPDVDYVILRHGDCIYKISREYNIDVNTLCHLNGITIHTKLSPGQKLYLKPQHYYRSSYFKPKPKVRPLPVHNGMTAIIPRKKGIMRYWVC